jgi:hypothetical protein
VHSRTQGSWDFLSPGEWTARSRLFVLCLALINVALVWSFRTPVIATGQDDAEYVLLSREIANGQYRDSYEVSAPPHAKYPPGYPAFLTGLSALLGEREGVFLFANALLMAGALLLFLDWGRRNLSTPIWCVLGGLVALNPEMILASGRILSEPLFLFLIYLSLWLENRETKLRSPGTLATVVASLTTLVRSAGLAVSVGLIGARLVQRRWMAAAALALLTAATGGWWAWHSARAPQPEERKLYVADFQKVLSIDESPMRAAVQRIRYKAEELTIDELPTALSVPVIRGHVVDNVFGALVILALLPLGLVLLWKRWKSAAAVLLGYGALYVVWPYGQVRLIVPVVPLIVLSLLLAAEYLGGKLRRPWAAPAAVMFLGLYLVTGLSLRLANERHRFDGCAKDDVPRNQPACFPQEGDWAFMQAAAYAREHIPPEGVVFTVKEAPFYYLSGRKTANAGALLKEDSTTLAAALRDRGVGWVMTSNSGPLRYQMGGLVARACATFELVKQFDARTMLLRLREPSRQADSRAACDALATWRETGVPREIGRARWRAGEENEYKNAGSS